VGASPNQGPPAGPPAGPPPPPPPPPQAEALTFRVAEYALPRFGVAVSGRAQSHSKNCTGLAQIARLGPTV
jgi:hypothetical protein